VKVGGIFVDEVPSSTQFVQYMAKLSSLAKQGSVEPESDDEPDAPGSSLEQPPPSSDDKPDASSPSSKPQWIVVYNPGVVIDPTFYQAADYVVAFENVAQEWNSPTIQAGINRLPAPLRHRSVAIAHSSNSLTDQRRLGAELNKTGFAGQFVTTQEGYTELCPNWATYVQEAADGWET
jgi:hypothetical protein